MSSDRDSDYAKKRAWYAASEIPLYLIVDPNEGICELHSQPRGSDYRTVASSEFGEDIELPEPFSFPLSTKTFKVYPPRRF
ncbi:Uma2 family endonuclease [Kitasatospora sp. GAS204A]|nr:Uma2 family endonuclease [Kitasatospora sp. GAS204B]